MNSRKSKKTRSYGEVPSGSLNTLPTSGGRPQLKDRVKSAPLTAHTVRQKHAERSQITTDPTTFPRRASPEAWPAPKETYYPPTCMLEHTGVVLKPSRDHDPVDAVEVMQEITLAVLGAAKAGKSTFVQCALDLKKPAVLPAATKKVSLEGVVSVLQLIEFSTNDMVIIKDREIKWPERVGDQLTPRIDGALIVYNVMDQGSMADIPEMLKSFSKQAIPTVLVAAKCDNDPEYWQIEHHTVEGIWSTVDGVESLQTSVKWPETHKRCISVILREIVSGRAERSCTNLPTTRPRALTTTHSSGAIRPVNPISNKSKHSRATSELPGSLSRGEVPSSSEAQYSGRSVLGSYREQTNGGLQNGSKTSNETSSSPRTPTIRLPSRTSVKHQAPSVPLSGKQALDRHQNPTCSPEDPRPLTALKQDTTIVNSFLDTEDDRTDYVEDSETAREVSSGILEPRTNTMKESGVSFDNLVDRLLSQPMSKADAKFAAIFLCLYRKFAAPSELMSAIIHRFVILNHGAHPQIVRIQCQLRYLSVLAQWITDYPGDFAHSLTRHKLSSFIASLAGTKLFAVASKEINTQLESVSGDDDTDWACSDNSRSRASTVESTVSGSSVQSQKSTLDANVWNEDIIGEHSPERGARYNPTQNSTTSSTASSAERSASQSTGSCQIVLSTIEIAQRQAQLLVPISRNPLTKIQWHQLMEIPDEEVARELTRIDWIMYSSIRPRDLVRHVILPVDQKEKCKSLENVNRMVDQFNHVAFWVANMILLRDKPKHRAKALEKFMGVAWRLRYMNNYNSLGAVIAGINGTAVHRLAQTRELVPPEVQKQFMRLEILMGTAKCHFAYRLAWGNTSSERIPFLPLHRRDLVFAEEGNRTHFGEESGRINWKKFEVMGEVIVEIQRSQGTPYPTSNRNEELQRLVLESRFSKDEDTIVANLLSEPDKILPGTLRA